jgi:hypothetical protein
VHHPPFRKIGLWDKGRTFGNTEDGMIQAWDDIVWTTIETSGLLEEDLPWF